MTSAAAAGAEAPTSPPLGRLGRTFQLEGALRCHVEGPLEADLLQRSRRVLVEGHGLLTVRAVRPHAGGLVIAFQGVRSPEKAQALVNARVYPDPADAKATATLDAARPLRVGLSVTLDGAAFGTVVAVVEGAQTLIEVLDQGGGRHLVPAGAPYVRVQGGGVALVDPPPGLLERD